MTLTANGEDMLFVEISTVDENGCQVENASDYVEVEVAGPGRLVGLDNGDSTDYDPYKGTIRKLFSGRLMAMIAVEDQPGEIRVTVRDARESVHKGELPAYTDVDKSGYVQQIRQAEDTDILREASLSIKAVPGEMQKGQALQTPNSFMPLAQVPVGFVPVRKLELVCADETYLGSEEQAQPLPENKLRKWTMLGPEKSRSRYRRSAILLLPQIRRLSGGQSMVLE